MSRRARPCEDRPRPPTPQSSAISHRHDRGLLERQPQIENRAGSAISRMARWCSTTSPRPISRDAAASWHSSATAATMRGELQIVYGLLCAPPTAARSPSRCSKADRRSGDPGGAGRQAQAAASTSQQWCWSVTAAWSPRRASMQDIGRLAWIGSPRCVRRRSRRWPPTTGRCSCRCSTSATWPRSPPDDYPGERLIVCRNPIVAAERRRKREELLAATERELRAIHGPRAPRSAAAARRRRDRPQAVGAVLGRRKMAKHFAHRHHRRPSSRFARNARPAIAAEAALDGIYVIRTSLRRPRRSTTDASVRAYKSLARVERAFRCIEDRRSRNPTDLPLDRTARARPRLALHARLSRRLARCPVGNEGFSRNRRLSSERPTLGTRRESETSQ